MTQKELLPDTAPWKNKLTQKCFFVVLYYVIKIEHSKLEPTDVLSSSVGIVAAAPAVDTEEDTTDCLTAARIILLVLFRDLMDEAAPWTIWLWTFKTDCLENDFPQFEQVTGLGLLPLNPELPFLFEVDFRNESRLEFNRVFDVEEDNKGFLVSEELLWLKPEFFKDLFEEWLKPNREDDDVFGILGVMVTDCDEVDDMERGTEGMACVETIGLPLTEWALKLDCGDPGLGCV